MNKFFHFIGIIGLIFLVSCTTARRYDHDPNVNFESYKTFNWLPISQAERDKSFVENSILDKRIKNLITNELAIKGLTLSPNNPDFFIAYHIPVKETEKFYSSFHGRSYFGYHYFGGHCYSPFGFYGDYHVSSYDEATIIIDIINAANRELIWRGWRAQPVYGPSISEKRLSKIVAQIFANFPPNPSFK